MIAIDGLSRRFGGTFALDRVSFDIRQGEILGLIGPNGSGKTTLLELLCGLLPADSGSVKWQSRALPPGRRKDVMFYVPDGITPYGEHPTEDVMHFFADVFGRRGADVDKTASALALAPVLRQRVSTLSKGYRRRLLLAIGLIAPHPLLLMDEPFDGFDLRQTRDVMALLRETADNGRTILLSIHQLADAERVADRFVLLSSGSVRGVGTLGELKARAGISEGGLEEVFLALT